MNIQVETLKITREQIIKILDEKTIEQINYIPSGFQNNLYWNAAHCLTVSQMIIYGLADQENIYDRQEMMPFRRGTFPDRQFTEMDIELLKERLIGMIEILQRDVDTQIFKVYKPFNSAGGHHVTNIESALVFNNFHEAMHLGHMLCIRKFL